MKKKEKKLIIGVFAAVLGLLAVLFVGAVGWHFWQLNRPGDLGKDELERVIPANFKTYNNARFGYEISYPSDWFVGFIGSSEEQAKVIWFGPKEIDSGQASGGVPAGVKFEIITFDLLELRGIESTIPKVASIKEWVDWQRSEWDEIQRQNIGEFKDEDVVVGGLTAIKTYFERSADKPEAGGPIEVQVFDPVNEVVFLFKYYGREPAYSENLENFEEILASFSF